MNHRLTYFSSYKGGTGRTTICVNTGTALAIRGLNVLFVDFDLESPGLPIFCSRKTPESLFQPENLVSCTKGHRRRLAEPATAVLAPDQSVRLNFWLEEQPEGCLYEVISQCRHPLEGRLFLAPLGGSFSRVPQIKEFTGWSYSPQGRTNERLVAQFNHEIYDIAKQKIEGMCKFLSGECGVVIDHVFVDGHPGISMRQFHEITETDNVVFVASASRGNLAGIAPQVALAGPTTRALVLSRVLPMASSDTQQESVGKEPQEALRSYLSQSRILDAILKHGPSGSFSKDSDLWESLQWYLNHYLPDVADRFSTNKKLVDTGLWRGNWLKEFPALESIIPIEWTRAQHVHDIVYDWRSFAQTGQVGADDLEQNVWGVCLLARHLEQSRYSEKTDINQSKNWSLHHMQALDQLQSGNLDAAEAACDQALRLQTEAVDSLTLDGQPVHPSWRGDWRLFQLKERILKSRGMIPDVIQELRSVHQQTIAAINQVSSPQFGDKLTTSKLQAFYDSLKSDIETEFSLNLYHYAANTQDRSVAKLACEAIATALDSKSPSHEILECATRLVCNDEFETESRTTGLEAALEKRLSALQTGRLRRTILLSQARLNWKRYQRNRNLSRESARQFLDTIIEKLREWQTLEDPSVAAPQADAGLAISDCAAFLGAIMLESAALSEPGMKRHFFLLAIEQFEQSTQSNLQEPVIHIWLALSRLGELCHPEIHLVQGQTAHSPSKPSVPNSTQNRGPSVEQIRQRDAFYAVEQAYAIYRDPRNPDFYFTGEAAAYLADNLTLTLQVFAEDWISKDSPLLHRLGISCPEFKRILATISTALAETSLLTPTATLERISELLRNPS